MTRILFVDDEPRLLEGLQRMLRPMRRQWDMTFANSGADALEILGKSPFDVIVTDMRMPEMDGAQLLECVRERFPHVIRIVLSGYFEKDSAIKAVPVAHQFLAKPCDPEKLREAIERSCGFSAMLADEATRRVIGAIGELPSLPRTSAALMEAIQKPDVSLEEVARIVEQDVGITAKVLQLVNSAFFGLTRDVRNVRSALSYLGMDTLRHLVLSVEIFRTFQPPRAVAGFSLEALQQHSQLAAKIAAKLAAATNFASTAVMAAMLHDSGKLVLSSRFPQQFETALQVSLKDRRPLHQVEEEMTGTCHAQIGAYLLGLWGLPAPIVTAVGRHHHPRLESCSAGLDVPAATHIADALAQETAAAAGHLDEAYVEALGLAGELPRWREMATKFR